MSNRLRALLIWEGACVIFLVAALVLAIIGGSTPTDQTTTATVDQTTRLINVAELPDESIELYLDAYAKIPSDTDAKDNILIVISEHPLADTFGATSVIEAPNHQYFLQYDSEATKLAALKEFTFDPEVKAFENATYELAEVYNGDDGPYNSWGVTAMGLDHAAELIGSTEADDVSVAIIDTGLDVGLFSQSYPGKLADTINIIEPGTEMADEQGHGTHIAGTIAEATPNNVKIIPFKVSKSNTIHSTDIITAVDYISHYHKADVVNMSFTGYSYQEPEFLAIEAAKQQGIVCVAAAGNDSTSELSYPSAFSNTISVSAIDSSRTLADFSNYGSMITFAAPGVDVLSLGGVKSGTSMATPHVVSAVAIAKSLNRDLSLEGVIKVLSSHTDDLGARGWDQRYGYGLINFSDAKLCRQSEPSSCDEYGLFEIPIPNAIEVTDVILTPYNYGSLTNILASKLTIATSTGESFTRALGDFDIDEILISGYDPYSSEPQIVTVEYNGLKTSFTITNPANYELGWGYDSYDLGGESVARLTSYKRHDLDIGVLYFPSAIAGQVVVEIGGECLFGTFDYHELVCTNPGDLSAVSTVVLPESITSLASSRQAFGSIWPTGRFANLRRIISYADELTVNSYAFANLESLSSVEANIKFAEFKYDDDPQSSETGYGLASTYQPSSYSHGVFAGDHELSHVGLSSENVAIPEGTFRDCYNLTSFVIPSSVITIDNYAFYESGIRRLGGTEQLAKIGAYAFASSDLEELAYPDSLRSIDQFAFFDTPIKSFHVPASLTSLGYAAFGDTANLTSLTVAPENPIYDSRDGSNAIIETASNTLIVGTMATTIPSTVETIAGGAFVNTLGLWELEIPEGVTTIQSNAFHNCRNLWKVVLPTSLQSMAEDSFIATTTVATKFFWVHRDSYAFAAVTEYDLPYVIIGEADPKMPVSGWLISSPNFPEPMYYEAFQTISPANLRLLICYKDVVKGEYTDYTEITDYTVEYQDGLDSLRATPPDETFAVRLTYDDPSGFHNLHIDTDLSVEKATPEYTVPTDLSAYSGQTLSEVALPDGFSWEEPDQILGDVHEATYAATYTPDDTDNYEIIRGIPIMVTVYDCLVDLGDVNGDSDIDPADLMAMRRHLVTGPTLVGPYLAAADITGDGIVNTVDYLRLYRHLIYWTPLTKEEDNEPAAPAPAVLTASATEAKVGKPFTITIDAGKITAWNLHLAVSAPAESCSFHDVDITPDDKDIAKVFTTTCVADSSGTITATLSGDITTEAEGNATVFSELTILVVEDTGEPEPAEPDPDPAAPDHSSCPDGYRQLDRYCIRSSRLAIPRLKDLIPPRTFRQSPGSNY